MESDGSKLASKSFKYSDNISIIKSNSIGINVSCNGSEDYLMNPRLKNNDEIKRDYQKHCHCFLSRI